MEPPSSSLISLLNPFDEVVDEALIERAALSALPESSREVCILLTDDDGIRELNQRFRGIDSPTDVLSFPGDGFPNSPLGDIAISVPYARRQAELREVSLDQELAYLAIHGALHLIGWDDQTDDEQERMVAEMNRIALLAGLPPDEAWHSLLQGAQARSER